MEHLINKSLLVHLCSGGLAHMLRLLSNSVDYSIRHGRSLMPVSANNPAFVLPFYDVFVPNALADAFVSKATFYALSESSIHHPLLGAIDMRDLSLGWKGVPDYSLPEPKNKSCYTLKIRGVTYEYPLALCNDDNFDTVRFTTGEFAHTDRYEVSYSALNYLMLSDAFSSYIATRKDIFSRRCVGVHHRNSADKTAPYSLLRRQIDASLTHSGYDEIFLATDNLQSLERIRRDYPDIRVHSYTPLIDLTSAGKKNLHTISGADLADLLGISKPDQVGLALADLWCLANCDYFVPSSSEFSRLASFFRSNAGVSQRFFHHTLAGDDND